MARQLRMVAGEIERARARAGEHGRTTPRVRGHLRVRAIAWCASAIGRLAAGGIAAPASAARCLAAWSLVAARRAATRAAVLALRSLVVAVALSAPALLLSVPGAGAQPVQPGEKVTGAGEIGAGQFGGSVALSADGDTALVGAPRNAESAGAAWVFTRSESSWGQQAQLTAPEQVGEAQFGRSVALSGDGETALVGAPWSRHDRGAVWVFTRSGSSWTEQAELTGGAEELGPAFFGHSVALSADGDTAVVAAPLDDGGVGAAWVFTRSGSSWTEHAELTGGEEIGDGHFGRSVAVSGDGDTAIVGGRLDDHGVGAAWVFTRSGSVWTQDGPKLTGEGEEGDGQFGYSVALSPEGETALIGGPNDHEDAGAAWVFTRSGSTWIQEGAKLTSQAASAERRFGSSVALSADGSVALAGDYAADRSVGGAWEFRRSGSEWRREGIFLTPEEHPAQEDEEGGEDQFGRSVALSASGETGLVGGPGYEESLGAAWIFEGAPVLHEVPSEEPEPGEETKPVGKHTGGGGGSSGSSQHEELAPLQTTETAKTGVLASKALQPPVFAASCKLVGSRLTVNHAGRVSAKLVCSGNHSASGKLTLTVTRHVKQRASGKGAAAKAKTITKTITIAGGTFAIAPNKTVTVTLLLTKTGRALLGAAHGHLTIAARLAKLLPTPAQTHTATVQLLLQKPASKKTRKK